jgi:hypothetical protein
LQAPFALPTGSHTQATSTGTGDVKTLAAPPSAKGFLFSALTNGVYFTLDGSVPSSSNGLHSPAGTAPVFIPLGKDIKFAADTAGNAIVSVIWCG